mmetsp:Transcript_31145/g.78689  ORF Transcript_31145/g.78689 Transcript_31145/m.78689 type:complete len:607 (-) Transcript_31145:334-2154(-)
MRLAVAGSSQQVLLDAGAGWRRAQPHRVRAARPMRARRGGRPARLSVGATATAPPGQGWFSMFGKRNSPGAPTIDQRVLRLNPAIEVEPEDVITLFGYPRNIDERYELKDRIGKGSFGVVSRVVCRETGREYACKSLAKVPKQRKITTGRHLLKIWNEIDCLKLLGRSLDAVSLIDLFEDDNYVHFILELCSGGELLDRLEETERLTENEARVLMHSVMRFVAQCHSKNIMYRDVNPVNFLFAADGRLQATDFGLAVRHAPGDEPITMRAGTPVYMSPEVVAREYSFAADCWSAGILCFQFMAGRYPYWDCRRIPSQVTLNQLFDIIPTASIDFSCFKKLGVSREAVDFMQRLLDRDPEKRLTAVEALEHPWFEELSDGTCCTSDLGCSIVQRLQHFAGNAHLRQHVLNSIADNLIFGLGNNLLTEDEKAVHLQPLVDIYHRLDESHSGELVSSDFLAVLQREGYNLTDLDMKKLRGHIHGELDERIMLDEFCTRLLDWSYLQKHPAWRTLLRSAFDELDVDGDGFISVADVTKIFTSPDQSAEYRTAQAQDILRECSVDACVAGMDWQEFCTLLTDYNLSIESLSHFDRRYIKEDESCDLENYSM